MFKIVELLLLFYIHGPFKTQLQFHYINIKPIKEECIRTQKTECDISEMVFKYSIRDNSIDIVEFSRSQTSTSLKQFTGLNKMLNSLDYSEGYIVQYYSKSEKYNIMHISNIPYDLYGLFPIYDIEIKTKVSFKIKFVGFKQNYYGCILIVITVTLNNADIDSLSSDEFISGFFKFYSIKVDEPYNKYKYHGERFYLCNSEPIDYCFSSFFNVYQMTYNDNIIKSNNKILFKLHFYSIFKKSKELHTINYFSSVEVQKKTEDYTALDIQCSIDCSGQSLCSFETKENLQNPKCNCGEYLFGNNCQYKYYCSNCQDNKCTKDNKCNKCKIGFFGKNCKHLPCSYLNMCGSYGNCTENEDLNECKCENNWIGKYCTKFIQSVNDVEQSNLNNIVTYSENSTTVSNKNITDIKSSKASVAIVAIIGSIFAIMLVVGIVIYIIKRKA